MRLSSVIGLAACALGVSPGAGLALTLTEEERAWIAANPVVRMAAEPNWAPIEHVENGRHMGLASAYIAAIARRTGLRFELVPDTGWGSVTDMLARGELDVMPAALREFTSPEVAQYLVFTAGYYAGSTLVITAERVPAMFDLSRLSGKVVAMKGGGAYQNRVQALHPDVKILPTATPEEALLAVVEGRADAALDTDAAMLPFLRRKYDGVLRVSGVISSMPIVLGIGVHRDQPVLHAIIDNALASLTAKETDEMERRWVEGLDFGPPSLQVLLRYYGPQFAFFGAGLLLISMFAWHAHRAQRRAVQSEKEKSMFLAVMSHEIRSPMNALLGSIELLQRADLPRESRRLIGVAASGAQNLLRLLDDVLDISKLEAGRVELDVSPVDVMELVRSVTDLLAFKAGEKGITLTVEESTPITQRLMLDRLRVGQILHNLVFNAIKFTLEGCVVVVVEHEADAQSSRKGWLHICVSDTGIGMDAAARQLLFEPYVQASAATAGTFGGTGLGLPICRELVELMQGSIDVESEPGLGTTITVHLPCEIHGAAVPAGSMPLASAAGEVRLNAGSRVIDVLLVEDTPANQIVLQAQLGMLGCRTTLAPDGETALQRLDESAYDVVLMDCDLPDRSGYDVARHWRERETSRGLAATPILAISASADRRHSAACLASGMNGVLKKPIKLGKLRDALQLWCAAVLDQADEVPFSPMDHRAKVQALKSDVDALRDAWLAGDLDGAAHHAHRLVGGAEILDARELAAAARELEAMLEQGGETAVEADLTALAGLDALLLEWAEGNAAVLPGGGGDTEQIAGR